MQAAAAPPPLSCRRAAAPSNSCVGLSLRRPVPTILLPRCRLRRLQAGLEQIKPGDTVQGRLPRSSASRAHASDHGQDPAAGGSSWEAAPPACCSRTHSPPSRPSCVTTLPPLLPASTDFAQRVGTPCRQIPHGYAGSLKRHPGAPLAGFAAGAALFDDETARALCLALCCGQLSGAVPCSSFAVALCSPWLQNSLLPRIAASVVSPFASPARCPERRWLCCLLPSQNSK